MRVTTEAMIDAEIAFQDYCVSIMTEQRSKLKLAPVEVIDEVKLATEPDELKVADASETENEQLTKAPSNPFSDLVLSKKPIEEAKVAPVEEEIPEVAEVVDIGSLSAVQILDKLLSANGRQIELKGKYNPQGLDVAKVETPSNDELLEPIKIKLEPNPRQSPKFGKEVTKPENDISEEFTQPFNSPNV